MKEIFRLCLVLTLLSAVSAGVLAFVYQKTADPIARAALEEKTAALRTVLPEFDNEPLKDAVVIETAGGAGIEFYRARRNGEMVGAAFQVVSREGYSGDIGFMIGVDTEGVIQGLQVLSSMETPGLGAKIRDDSFIRQYNGKSITDPENWAVTKDGGTFVPITGATISSRAVTKAAAGGLAIFAANRERILGVAADGEGDKEGDR